MSSVFTDPLQTIRNEVLRRVCESIEELKEPTEVSLKVIQIGLVKARFTEPSKPTIDKLPIVSFGYGGSNSATGGFTNDDDDFFTVIVYATLSENINTSGNIITKDEDGEYTEDSISLIEVAARMHTAMQQIVSDLNVFTISSDDGRVDSVKLRQVLSGEGKFTKFEILAFRIEFRVSYNTFDITGV